MPRRKVDPFAVKAAAVSTVFVALVGAFGAYVIGHERAALARARTTQAAAQSKAVGQAPEASIDDRALASLQVASAIASDVFVRSSSYSEAGVSQLTAVAPKLLFVDGPSQSPEVVSVTATDSVWAAAVKSDDGCRWIALFAGVMRQGSDGACVAGEVIADLGA